MSKFDSVIGYRAIKQELLEICDIHERTAKHSKTATQQIDIYFRYIGKLAPEQVA